MIFRSKNASFPIGKECPAFGKKLRTERWQAETLVKHVSNPHYRRSAHTESLKKDEVLSSPTRISAYFDQNFARFQVLPLERPTEPFSSRRTPPSKTSFHEELLFTATTAETAICTEADIQIPPIL